MFPSNSYTTTNSNCDSDKNTPIILINNKEIKFRVLDFFYQ